MTHKFIPFVLLTFIATTATAQNVGIGTNTPGTKLHVSGAIASTPSSGPAGATITIPANVTIYRITDDGASAANAVTATSPVEGQYLTIYNTDAQPATFTASGASQTIAAVTGVMTFEYINGAWQMISDNTAGGGNYIKNQTSADQSGAGFRTVGNGYFNSAASQVAIGTATPASGYQLTLTPNSTTGGGISIAPSGASGNGINIAATSSGVNGINVTNSSTSTSANFFGVSGILSSTRIVSGYLGYRDGSGNSFGLYGVNGTIGTYATAANTWAGFLQGRTVISSESAPSSAVGTDLEVRNTNTGAAAPATVSLRQTTSETTSGTVLANVNFGDNYVTTPQAQIQVIRDATSSNASDLPTAIALSTTPDGSTTLTERMRVTNTGNVGIGSTAPATYLQLGNTNNLANSYLTFAVGNTSLGTNRTWQIGVPYGGSTTSSPNYGFAITDVNVSTSVTAASTPFMIDYITHNVGIGTITPSNLLSVGSSSQFQVTSGGAIAAATGITSSGAITFSGLSTLPGLVYANTSGVLSVATASNLPSGSGSYVQINPSSQQSGSFSISGTGVIGGNATVSGGTLTMNNGSSNTISFATSGLAGPSTSGTPSVGTRLLLYPSSNNPTGVNAADWAIGMNSGMIWYGVSQPIAGHAHVFYGGPNELMRIEGNGAVGIGTSSPGSNLLNVSSSSTNGYGINLAAQTGTSGGTGGAVTISSGAGNGTSNGGNVTISTGTNGNASNGGTAGSIYLSAGSGSSSTNGVNGGSVNISAGSAWNNGGSGSGGSVNITAGGNLLGANSYGNINFITYAGSGTSTSEAMFISGSTGAVGIGGLTAVPKQSSGTSIGLAMFAMDGPNGSSSGPHVQYTTAADAYPIYQQLNWSHDNISRCFDCYYDGSNWRTGGSSLQIPIQEYKISNVLYFRSAAAAAAGSTITAWNNMLTMSASGVAIGANGTSINSLQAGNVAITAPNSSGQCNCNHQTVTISYSFPSGTTPNIVCTVQGQTGTSYGDTFATQVQSRSNTSAVINIYRVDASTAWGQSATLSWMAWY